jgi:hypothetical protein
VGATAGELIAFWLAEAMPVQFLKRPKFIEPHEFPWSWVVAYTRFWSLKATMEKSLSEAHPDLGLASAPVEVQVYVEGRLHAADTTIAIEARTTMWANSKYKLAFSNRIALFNQLERTSRIYKMELLITQHFYI